MLSEFAKSILIAVTAVLCFLWQNIKHSGKTVEWVKARKECSNVPNCILSAFLTLQNLLSRKTMRPMKFYETYKLG